MILTASDLDYDRPLGLQLCKRHADTGKRPGTLGPGLLDDLSKKLAPVMMTMVVAMMSQRICRHNCTCKCDERNDGKKQSTNLHEYLLQPRYCP